MGEDFVRYYIGNISSNTLRIVMQKSGKFDEWQLIDGSKFELEKSYGYEHNSVRDGDKALIKALAKRCVIAENRNPKGVQPSIIWNNSLVITDILTFLSLARAKNYPILIVEKNLGDQYTVGFGVTTLATDNKDIVSFGNLSQFISKSLTLIERNPDWLKDSGFDPSIFWYTQAQQSVVGTPSILKMALYWVSIEILASIHLKNKGLCIRGKEQRVRKFIKDKGYTGTEWRFLSRVIEDWYMIRSSAFHEGKDPELPVDVLKARRQQVRDFVSLVLVEMLEDQGQERKIETARRMQSY